MAISYFPLSVNVAQIVGTPVKRARLLIDTNLPQGTPLAYGSEMVTPGGIYEMPGGVGEITLPTTAGLTNVTGGTLQYVITGEYSLDGVGPVKLDPIYIDAPATTAAVSLASFIGITSAPPTFMGAAVATLQAKVDEAEVIKQYVTDVSNIDTPDALVGTLASTPGTATATALNAAIGTGANLSRVIARAQAGRPIKAVSIGDSVLEGTTVTSGGGVLGVDDALSLVAADIASRFGVTTTKQNRAKSGHTVAMGPLSLIWNSAVTDQADLYLISYRANDSAAERFATPVRGYSLDAYAAGLERLFRRLRKDAPRADIGFVIYGDYNTAITTTENVAISKYAKRAIEVCAAYGVEVIDARPRFRDTDGISPKASLYADSIHPNKAGHAALAAAIMEHIPAARVGAIPSIAGLPTGGLYSPEEIGGGQDSGADFVLAPTAGKWVESGTGWSTSGSNRTTTTAGDAISGGFTGTELYVMLDTSTTADLHATLVVDGVTVYTNQAFDANPVGVTWVMVATGLTAGAHTWSLTLVSGTLTVGRVGWLGSVGSSFNADVQHVVIGSGSTLTQIPTAGTSLVHVNEAITLPSGWLSADVYIRGWVAFRVTAATTTVRHLRTRVIVDSVERERAEITVLPVPENTYARSSFSAVALGLGVGKVLLVDTSLFSTDKTLTYATGHHFEAMLVRRS